MKSWVTGYSEQWMTGQRKQGGNPWYHHGVIWLVAFLTSGYKPIQSETILSHLPPTHTEAEDSRHQCCALLGAWLRGWCEWVSYIPRTGWADSLMWWLGQVSITCNSYLCMCVRVWVSVWVKRLTQPIPCLVHLVSWAWQCSLSPATDI